MELLQFPRAGEKIFHEVLENGLNVFVFPKPEFQKSYAFFATRYGGMDTRFCLNGQWQDTPAGIAHYLEHKMFDTKEGNALQELAKNGAEPNAFTSNAMTGYYFDSTSHFDENLEILLSFVSIPYFTGESVAKEQGIIAQEIRMIEDNPDWQIYARMLRALYSVSTARTSIAGTVESISRITAETLYDCHKAFYTPSNMILTVVGNVDPVKVSDLARRILPKEGPRDSQGLRQRARGRGSQGGPHGHGGLQPPVPGGLEMPPRPGGGGAPPPPDPGQLGLRPALRRVQPPVPAALQPGARQFQLRRRLRADARRGLSLCRRREQGAPNRSQ